VPQLDLSSEVSTQPVAHSVWVPEHPHTPAEQVDVPGQAWPHEPQLALSVSSLAQAEPQTWSPAGHAQAPPLQIAPAGQG